MHSKLRIGGLAAVVSATTLVLPLLAIGSAQAAAPAADLSITKTVSAAKTGTIIDASQFIPGLSDTRATGHYEFVSNGLHVWTQGANSSDKVAEYFQVSGPLPSTVSLDWTGTSARPGNQIIFDADGVAGSGNEYNLLVGEPVYGGDYWLTKSSSATAKLAAPSCDGDPSVGAATNDSTMAALYANHHCTGGSGSPWHGTLAQWKAALQQATMYAGGFSLGSGVLGDGVIGAITYDSTRFDFGGFASSVQAAPGSTVEYKLAVANKSTATAAATNVVVADTLPADLTYLPGSLVDNGNGCGFEGRKLTCNAGTFPVGVSTTIKFKATVNGKLSTAGMQPTQGHWVDVQKQETFLNLPAGETVTGTAICPAGYLPTDGGLLVDSVDQGGFYSDIVVDSSRPTVGNDGWTVGVRNLGEVRATGKVKVTCLQSEVGSSNGHSHTLLTGAATEVTTIATTGTAAQVDCPTGYLPIAPQFTAQGGIAVIRSSYATGRSWNWVIDGDDGASVTLKAKCLSSQTSLTNGHSATLDLTTGASTVSVGSEGRKDAVLQCPEVGGHRGNGIVGGYQSASEDLLSLGSESRGNNYMFRFWNDGDVTQSTALSLSCVDVRTDDEQPFITIRNTATVTGSGSSASSSADLRVIGEAITPTTGTVVTAVTRNGNFLNVTVKTPTASTVAVRVYRGTNVAAKGNATLSANTAKVVKAKLTSYGKQHLPSGAKVTVTVTIKGASTVYGPFTLS